ncbi:hypothetical protein L596_010454 [Steinernema carpocapsae]|uniref:Uncharacterized protein n=1 Tax=Steinernema carpocapsae TaxID=34508 RepID=A0A4U5PIH3_STECR|nr:hypothetical protein L596_010454 [Steinernema carpocapsae]
MVLREIKRWFKEREDEYVDRKAGWAVLPKNLRSMADYVKMKCENAGLGINFYSSVLLLLPQSVSATLALRHRRRVPSR